MPWTETRVVDQRTEFVLRVLSNRERFGNLCREFGVSRKTGYKWKERFFEDGLAPLARIPPRRQNGPNLRLLPHPQPAQRVTRQPVHDEAGGSRVSAIRVVLAVLFGERIRRAHVLGAEADADDVAGNAPRQRNLQQQSQVPRG